MAHNTSYMLDTNIASHIIRDHPVALEHMRRVPVGRVFVSTITEAELRHGIERKPEATRLGALVRKFLDDVNILPWDSAAAHAYAKFATVCERQGLTLGAFDRLIAAHSIAAGMVLVTNDKAFSRLSDRLRLADWTQ